jgi:hypothetical protein
MSNAPAISVNPWTASQVRCARWRVRALYALIGFYFFVAFAAPILTGETGFLLLKSGWRDVDQHWLYGCVILIAGWVALGPGQMAIRAPQGLIAVGWLLLAWLLGLTMSPNWKFELEATTSVCAATAAATFVILKVVRRCSRMMLVPPDGPSGQGTKRFQYSLTTLFLAMLLICVTFALCRWIDPRYRSDLVLSHWYYDPWLKGLAWVAWKGSLGPLLIAAACLPAFLSRRKTGFAWALVLSAAALAVTVLIDARTRGFVLFPLVQGQAVATWVIDYYLVHDIANIATTTLCLLTAAAAMHWMDYRLLTEPAREMRA